MWRHSYRWFGMDIKTKENVCPECGAGLYRGPINIKTRSFYGEYCMTSVWVKGSCNYRKNLDVKYGTHHYKKEFKKGNLSCTQV